MEEAQERRRGADRRGVAKSRIVIVDGHTLFRRGVRNILELEADIEVVGEAGTGREALAVVEEMTPDEARSELLPVLGSPVFIDMLLSAWNAALGQPAFVSSTFAELTAQAPRSLLEWATDYAAERIAWRPKRSTSAPAIPSSASAMCCGSTACR